MSATAIRQAPGWWPSLVRAECDDCGWRGPIRDLSIDPYGRASRHARWDRDEHKCGEA